jgi:tRNA(Ile)-lysidine synthase TilS/MesJ
MPWKKEHNDSRREKYRTDPAYREKRLAQSSSDPQKRAEYMQEYYRLHPEKFRRSPEKQAEHNTRRRERYASDPTVRGRLKAEVKEWQKNNPAKRKAQRLRKFGLTHEEFLTMLASQNNECAVCGFSDMTNPNMFPVVDHCHKTGRVRGLLCMNCNQGLGKFKDSERLLIAAVKYLSNGG